MKDGKKCPACDHINTPGDSRCGGCGTDIEFVDVEKYAESDFEGLPSSHSIARTKHLYDSEYKVATAIAFFLSFAGWVLVIAGTIFTLWGISVSSEVSKDIPFMVASLPGIGIAVCGLVLIAAAQVTKATVDNADHTREILKLLKNKLENI